MKKVLAFFEQNWKILLILAAWFGGLAIFAHYIV